MNIKFFLATMALFILSAIFFSLRGYLMTVPSNVHEFKVGFPYETSLSEFDPARVQVAGQYAFLENLYIPLLLRDNLGRLIPGAASKFYWVDDEIEFEINKDLVDSEGQKITVEDAYFSLMRLLVLGSSTHGDLKKLICPDSQPKSVNDQCAGIRIVDGKLRLKPSKKTFTIFENFSSIDFAVIPKRSVDPNDLRSLNLSITSGVYSVKERRSDGAIVLRANPRHFLYSQDIPQNPVFIPTRESSKSGLELFESGQIDLLSTLDQTDISERIDKYRDSNEATLFQTLPVRLELLVFTQKGLQLSSDRRWAVGNAVANQLASVFGGRTGYQSTYQYFPEGGKGSLTDEQLSAVLEKRKTPVPKHEDGSELVLGFFARNFDRMRPVVQEILPGIQIVQLKRLPSYDSNVDAPEYPHLYIVSMDTGFLEQLPNVINSLKSGFLGTTEQERELWIEKYLYLTDEEQRLQALKQLHLESLLNPVIIPILRTPYVSVIRKPWRADFSILFPNSPLWKISKN